MSIFSFLKSNKATKPDLGGLKVDIHSHLIPGIDDGVQNMDECLTILKEMEHLGYQKVITTPHTMVGSYDNTPEIIYSGLEKVKTAVQKEGLNIEIEAATEYFLDESFMEKLDSGEKLMTFSGNHVLVETSFISPPPQLKEASFQLTMKGYKMVFAHPERYLYLIEDKVLLEELIDRDIIFQLNAVALTGCYSKPIQKFAEKLIDMKIPRLVGTDCHHMRHIDLLKEATMTKHWKRLLDLDLLNNSL
ncbi:tyrosine-protein phosphatase [Roseivirga misakiensis]|uniref:protein-tyrosine-phosphatase n=1 Tax=Roseivirga misakiensis TaxID=1563681 RepID=A0A1E5T600_9BACT|nr:CpsB/CapC family capsule biosynthesis tyrosine phosphatase [Roseivirga misakiensis]OEK06727.1 capsular biosynthesis protein [Roseivirga misakiensis]